jgi:hypothetical protein
MAQFANNTPLNGVVAADAGSAGVGGCGSR